MVDGYILCVLATTLLAIGLIPISSAQDGVPPKQTEKLACRLTLSIDMSVEDRWYHSASERGIQIPESTVVVRQQAFGAYVFLDNYGESLRGDVKLDYDLRITKPSGALHRAEEKLEGRSGLPPENKEILLAQQVLRIAFEAEDPLGMYTITVFARDHSNGTSKTVKKTIELVEQADSPGFEDRKSFDAWWHVYYKSPEPRRAIQALLDVSRMGVFKEEKELPAVSAFFLQVFEGNPWLFPRLLARYENQHAGERQIILWLLAHSSFSAPEFVAALKGEDLDAWKRLSDGPPRDPLNDPITDLAHVEQLWGMFFASGRFLPIHRLCEALSPEDSDAIPDGASRAALKAAAAASIGSRARQHPLVRSYCEWILASDKVSERATKDLSQALKM